MRQRLIGIILVIVQFGLLAAIFLSPALGVVTYSQIINILGPILLVAGVVIGLLGIAGLHRSLSIFPTPNKKTVLITSGIYNYIRHPMYTGLILIGLSFTICQPSGLGIGLMIG